MNGHLEGGSQPHLGDLRYDHHGYQALTNWDDPLSSFTECIYDNGMHSSMLLQLQVAHELVPHRWGECQVGLLVETG